MRCKEHGFENSKTCLLGKPKTERMKKAVRLASNNQIFSDRCDAVVERLDALKKTFFEELKKLEAELATAERLYTESGNKLTDTYSRLSSEELQHLFDGTSLQ